MRNLKGTSGQKSWHAAWLCLAGMAGWLNGMVQEVSAHGAVSWPMSRQYSCFLDGGFYRPADGSGILNQGCRNAYLAVEGGVGERSYQFIQWNNVSATPVDPSNFETVMKAVPDGLLCAGGDKRKKGLDVPQDRGWRKSKIRVPEYGHIKLRWENTQAHSPAWVRVFITKPSYDPAKHLRWSDLELIYGGEVMDSTPVTRDDRGHLPSVTTFYDFDVPISRSRRGDAILYSYLQRQDAGDEGFFNCSDVMLEDDDLPHVKGVFQSPYVSEY